MRLRIWRAASGANRWAVSPSDSDGRADRAFAQGGCEQFGLDAERRKFAFDQAAPVRTEIEHAGEKDREREDVDGENAQRDRRDRAAPPVTTHHGGHGGALRRARGPQPSR
jgi:hypothetical protein